MCFRTNKISTSFLGIFLLCCLLAYSLFTLPSFTILHLSLNYSCDLFDKVLLRVGNSSALKISIRCNIDRGPPFRIARGSRFGTSRSVNSEVRARGNCLCLPPHRLFWNALCIHRHPRLVLGGSDGDVCFQLDAAHTQVSGKCYVCLL